MKVTVKVSKSRSSFSEKAEFVLYLPSTNRITTNCRYIDIRCSLFVLFFVLLLSPGYLHCYYEEKEEKGLLLFYCCDNMRKGSDTCMSACVQRANVPSECYPLSVKPW